MDKQSLAVMIPVLAVFFIGIIAVSKTMIGHAIARRIGGESGGDLEQRLAAVERELDGLHHELAETHERLDFAERTLARVKDLPRLPEAQGPERAP